jgi:hypothetical protein
MSDEENDPRPYDPEELDDDPNEQNDTQETESETGEITKGLPRAVPTDTEDGLGDAPEEDDSKLGDDKR